MDLVMHLDRTGPSPLLPAVDHIEDRNLAFKAEEKRVNSKYIQCEITTCNINWFMSSQNHYKEKRKKKNAKKMHCPYNFPSVAGRQCGQKIQEVAFCIYVK